MSFNDTLINDIISFEQLGLIIYCCLNYGLYRLHQHYENMPIQIYWKFYNQKTGKFPDKNYDIFRISAQNIDCGCSLEPPRRGSSNEYPKSMFWAEIRKIMYTPVNPSFTI